MTQSTKKPAPKRGLTRRNVLKGGAAFSPGDRPHLSRGDMHCSGHLGCSPVEPVSIAADCRFEGTKSLSAAHA